MWVGGGITGMGEIPMLGVPVKGLTALIKKIFYNGAQGFAYDPNDLTAEKLNWRRNLLTWTEDFSNFVWGLSNSSLTVNSIIAPDGTMTAYKLIPNTSGGVVHQIYAQLSGASNIKAVSGQIYTESVYVKAGEYTQFFMNFWQASDKYAYFDLTNGTVITKNPGIIAATITSVGNGWFRCSITGTAVTGDLSIRFGIAENGTYMLAGNGTSGLYLWGAQAEKSTSLTGYQTITDFNSEFIKRFPLHTLYQDAAGAIPVTAAGQPVGLMLDKSKGLVLGAEINTNKNFSTWSSGAPAGYVTFLNNTTTFLSQDSNGVRFQSTDGSNVQLTRGVSTYKFYQVEVNVHSITAGSVAVVIGGFTIKLISSPGIYTVKFYSASNTGFDLKRGGGVSDFIIRSLSIKEISGNHAYQATSASRPLLQATPILGNELIVNGDFSDGTVGYTSIGSITMANVKIVNGEVEITGNGGGYPGIRKVISDLSIGKRYAVSVLARRGTTTSTVNLNGNASGASSSTVSESPVKLEISFIADTTFKNVDLSISSPNATGTAYFTNLSVREVIGYRTDKNYLSFDGTDDFLQTSSIDFTATNKVSLFVGVRKLSDASAGMVCELGSNVSTVAGTFFIAASPGALAQITAASNGTVARFADATNLPAPISTVISASSDITANTLIIRANGTQRMKNTVSQGGGKYANYPLHIGRRSGVSLPFNGHIYGLIGVGKLVSDTETTAIEKELAKRVGVTLNV